MHIIHREVKDPSDHGDVFEELIEKMEINFVEINPGDLDGWAHSIYNLLKTFDADLKIGDTGVEAKKGLPPSICFKVMNIRGVCYVDVYPHCETFSIIKDLGHHDGLHHDEGMACFYVHKYPHLNIQVARDESGLV